MENALDMESRKSMKVRRFFVFVHVMNSRLRHESYSTQSSFPSCQSPVADTPKKRRSMLVALTLTTTKSEEPVSLIFRTGRRSTSAAPGYRPYLPK
jgi:hypothetical protein